MRNVRIAGEREGAISGPAHRPFIFPLMRWLASYLAGGAIAGVFLFTCIGCGGGGGGGDGGSNVDPEIPVDVADPYCIDIYEASRTDATAGDAGIDDSTATSREGVLPWRVLDNETADQACRAAGKWLCTPEEWEYACRGPNDTVYAYGEDYEMETCNGLEAFGEGNHHVTPTGSFEECTNAFGVYDMSGNLWEHTSDGDGTTVRGGAYNCYSPEARLRCDYIPGNWVPTALGFRCCKSRESGECPADMVDIVPE